MSQKMTIAGYKATITRMKNNFKMVVAGHKASYTKLKCRKSKSKKHIR